MFIIPNKSVSLYCCNEATTLNFRIMAFLISTSNKTSEWLNDFNSVQIEMNKLEKQGIVSNVNVQMFKGNILSKNFVYDFNGQVWEKR